MKTNKILMKEARDALKGNWGIAVGGCFLALLLIAICAYVPFGTVLLVPPLFFGCAIFILGLARRQDVQIGHLFSGFSFFGKSIGIYWLYYLRIILWCIPYIALLIYVMINEDIFTDPTALYPAWFWPVAILLLIPPTIEQIKLALTWFLSIDDEDLGIGASVSKSVEVMKGYKWKFFFLNLRFIGWYFLSIITFGIGLLWFVPYLLVAYAKFYEDAKAEYQGDNEESAPVVAIPETDQR